MREAELAEKINKYHEVESSTEPLELRCGDYFFGKK
jgi:hypothetical protein